MKNTSDQTPGAVQAGNWLNITGGKSNAVLASAAAEANIAILRSTRKICLFAPLSLRENIIAASGNPKVLPDILKQLEITTFTADTQVGSMTDFDRFRSRLILHLCSSNDRIILPLAGSALDEQQILKVLDCAEKLIPTGKTVVFTTADPSLARSRAQVYHILSGETVLHSGNSADADITGEYAHVCEQSKAAAFPQQPRKSAAMVMEVLGLQVPGFKGDISLNARKGEILGIYGLGECGMDGFYKTLTARATAGKGIVTIAKSNIKARTVTPAQAIAAGTGILPRDDFLGALSTAEQNSLPVLAQDTTLGITRCGKINNRVKSSAEGLTDLLADIPESLQPDAEFAQTMQRMLATDFEVFIFRNCDSTYKYVPLLRHIAGAIAASGKAVVWFTSDLQEIFNMCDMTAVLHNGTLCPPRQTSKWTPQEVTGYANSATAGAFSIL